MIDYKLDTKTQNKLYPTGIDGLMVYELHKCMHKGGVRFAHTEAQIICKGFKNYGGLHFTNPVVGYDKISFSNAMNYGLNEDHVWISKEGGIVASIIMNTGIWCRALHNAAIDAAKYDYVFGSAETLMVPKTHYITYKLMLRPLRRALVVFYKFCLQRANYDIAALICWRALELIRCDSSWYTEVSIE